MRSEPPTRCNIAGTVEGESIGLLSVNADGLHRPEVWFEDASGVGLGIHNWYFGLDAHAIARMPHWSLGGTASSWVGLVAGVGF